MATRQGKGCIYRRGKIWWVKLTVDGETIYESTESTVRDDAVQLLRLRQGELAANALPAWLKPSVTVGKVLELVPADLKAYQKKDLANVERQIRRHLGPFFEKIPVKRLSTAKIHEYIAKRQAENAAAATINRELATLRRGLRLALEHDPPLVGRHFRIRMLREDNVRQGFLTEQQYLALRKELPDYQQLALVIAYHVGIRRGELLALKWEQVDFDAGKILLRGSQTKSGHARVLPIYGEMEAWLRFAKAERDLKCPDTEHVIAQRCKPVTWFYQAWRTACAAAGVHGLLFHDLRRTAVRNMLDAGIDEKTAMLITGHRTRAMIDRYNIRNEKDVLAAGRKLDEYRRRKAAEGAASGDNSGDSQLQPPEKGAKPQ
jgi:integrase